MEKYTKSLEQIKKFLDNNSSEKILDMMKDWGIQYEEGIGLDDYFQGLEQALNPENLVAIHPQSAWLTTLGITESPSPLI